jgi:hypothetical protein
VPNTFGVFHRSATEFEANHLGMLRHGDDSMSPELTVAGRRFARFAWNALLVWPRPGAAEIILRPDRINAWAQALYSARQATVRG